MSIQERDKITVCKGCLSSNLDGAEHQKMIPDGYESADVICLWNDCGHVVGLGQRRCWVCNQDEPPF